MDINKGLYYSGNNDAIYRKCLVDFYKDSLRRRELLRDLAGTDIERYMVEVHALKGIARNIGAMQLSEMAYLHEEAVKEEQPEYVAEHLELLLGLWNKTMAEIEEYLGGENLGDDLAGATNGQMLTDSETVAAAKLCILHLKHFEEEQAAAVIRKALDYEMPDDLRELLTKVYREIEDFEYDRAIAMLEAIA